MSEKPVTIIRILSWQAKHIVEPSGPGGHQAFHRRLLETANVLDDGSYTWELDDEHLGELIRHFQYGWDKGSGGFQGRLRKAFGSKLAMMLGLS
jgi:hypothetical protein